MTINEYKSVEELLEILEERGFVFPEDNVNLGMTTPSRNLFKKIEAVNQNQMSLRLDCSGQETEWDYFIWDTGREDLKRETIVKYIVSKYLKSIDY